MEKRQYKDVSDIHRTFWFVMPVALSSLFRIPLHVSATSLYDWLHVRLNELSYRLSLGGHHTYCDIGLRQSNMLNILF